MAATVISPTLDSFPDTVLQPIVEVKPTWSSAWIWVPEVRLRTLRAASSGQDLSSLTGLRPYGPLKHPWQAGFAARAPLNLTDWWVRVRSTHGTGPDLQTIWLGRFSDEDRELFASSQGRSGMQVLVAYGPAQILRKRRIDKSYWMVELEERLIGWIPPINDPTNSERGNRTESAEEDIYLYGGEELWDYRQHAEYLLAKFLDESDDGGPVWRLAGAANVLTEIKEPITWGTTQTAAAMLKRLIPIERGLDYTIRLITNGDEELGFEVFVYALSAKSFSFGSTTLPSNPDTARVLVGAANNLRQTRLTVSQNQHYRTLRILGKQIVVCLSLWGELAAERADIPAGTVGVPDPTPDPPPPADPLPPVATLVGAWLEEIEEEYRKSCQEALGTDWDADNDRYREQDKFHGVYQSFGAVDDWDWNDGTAAPLLDDFGELVEEDPDDPDLETVADWQNTIRHTLSWIPLLEGVDYTVIKDGGVVETEDPAPEDPEHDEPPDYLAPVAWIFDPYTYRYLASEKLDISIQPKRHDWGVLLQCSPNHLVAENHFDEQDGEELDYTVVTATWPRYDFEEMAVTIAIESDQRFQMESILEGATDQDGVMEIATDAEFHFLAPNTILGASIDPDDPAGLLILSGDEPYVLRSDKELMELTMAAAISRYQADRKRARLTLMGFLPWQFLVGHVLATVEEIGGVVHTIDAPITSITWQAPDGGGSPTTILEAGFAG